MSTRSEPLAHSARRTVAAQSYKAHIERVTALAEDNARRAAQYLQGDRDFFVESVRAAAIYHDLGKLDEENQRVLIRSATEALPLNHVDAGTAQLLELKRLESSLLAFAHHIGLPSIVNETIKKDRLLRDSGLFAHTNERLSEYLAQHDQIMKQPVASLDTIRAQWSGLTRRMALSCLVDADHTDTAEHYGNERLIVPPKLLPEKRLQALDAYVTGLTKAEKNLSARNQIRQEVYLACRNAQSDIGIVACDSPVGTGKTTAIVAHLLQAAVAKDLRRVFIVLPYTNIIKQSIDVYREALILSGENPEEIVAEHHHQADFSSREFRHLAQLWNSPIVVTTAVQFFETLGNNHPARLRKLHEVAGSAILVDESHAAIPAWLWPQVWIWLKELVNNWGCHIVLASGSLVRFWELQDFIDPPITLPELVSTKVREAALFFESHRVTYKTHEGLLNLDSLIQFVLGKPGPRLLILNTVQSAAVIANTLRSNGQSVFHLSTALCPVDRVRIVEQIAFQLKKRLDADWTLVATSCVEAGMDFSFRTAFRESCGLVNLIQIGGRSNRSGEYQISEVWDFRVLDPLLTSHPAFETSRNILDEMFRENRVDGQFATEAMRREAQRETFKKKSEMLKKEERSLNYPEVSKLCRVIETDTRTVVVNPAIIEKLERREPVDHSEIIQHSVQIWSDRLNKLPAKPVRGSQDLMAWVGSYEPDFLGYMAGVLPLLNAQNTGVLVY